MSSRASTTPPKQIINDGTYNANNNQIENRLYLGLYGWRKKCLYTLILCLMILIFVNLGLTLWILKVMEFSSDGIGLLKVMPGGLQLTGQALILDILRASVIRSKHGHPVSIDSSRNFTVNTRKRDGTIDNQIMLSHDKLESIANKFIITDSRGDTLFSSDRHEVTIGAHSLHIQGDGGAIFQKSVQTPLVYADAGKELKLESPTRSLEIEAAQHIQIKSKAGSIEASCLKDIKLQTFEGKINFESEKIFMPNIKIAQPIVPVPLLDSKKTTHQVYQLCACGNGRLFLAAPHSICADEDSSVCR